MYGYALYIGYRLVHQIDDAALQALIAPAVVSCLWVQGAHFGKHQPIAYISHVGWLQATCKLLEVEEVIGVKLSPAFVGVEFYSNPARRFLQHCQCVKAGCFWLTPVQLIEEHCQLRAGNGYLTVTHRRPDKLAFLQAFGEQAQTISISPKNFNGVPPSATEDKQVTGEGIIIQHMLYLFSQSVEGFTHIGNAGNEPDTGT